MGFGGRGTHPPGFLRKDVILWELSCCDAQGFDSRDFTAAGKASIADSEPWRGLVGAITTHDSIYCLLCQWHLLSGTVRIRRFVSNEMLSLARTLLHRDECEARLQLVFVC